MPTDQAANPIFQFIVPYALIILIFYFLVFKPQKTQKLERKKMLEGVKKNDEIVTSGGIHGTVVNVKETTVVIRIDDNAKLEIDKDAVVSIKKTT